MPTGVWTITDIPEDEVDKVVADFNLNSPDSVERIRQANGRWTVKATWPGAGNFGGPHGGGGSENE